MFTAHGPYAAWASWLDAFASGEDLPAAHLAPVDENFGAQMQQRLLGRLEAAFRSRAGMWADALRRHLSMGPVRHPGELAEVLMAARNRLRPLRGLAMDRRLPDAARTALFDALRNMVTEAQESLEDSARRQPQGGDQLLSVIRENSLLAALGTPVVPPSWSRRRNQPPPPVGRRVIL